MLQKFKLGQNPIDSTKNICCAKGEDESDQSTVTKWFWKFCFNCMNLDNQAISYRPKTMHPTAFFQDFKLSISQSSVIHHH